MRRSAAVVVAAATLALGACSGDDGGAASSSTSASTTPATVDAAAADFCDAYGGLLVGPLAEGGFDPNAPEQLRAAVDATRPLVTELRTSAPAEIATPAAAVADAYDEAFAVFERYGYDLTRVDAEASPAEQHALDSFGQGPTGPGLEDPYEDVDAFVAERCAPGVTLPLDLTATTSP